MVYNIDMKNDENKIKVRYTPAFQKWFGKLKDPVAKAAIHTRIARLRLGLFGDAKRFGNVSEIRVDVGQGYRVYYTMRGDTLVILLLGGDKSSQDKDFKQAYDLAKKKFDFEE